MISLFSSCKATLLGGELLVLLFVMTRLYDGASLASVLLLIAIGSILCFLGASLYAVALHHRLLLTLYALEKPEDFIRIYEPLLHTKHLAANVRFTMTAYLSNGYAAAGDFSRARSLLDGAPTLSRLQRAECDRLLAGNRASIALAEENAQEAAAQCDRLDALIASSHLSRKKRAAQQSMLRTLRAQTAVLEGSCVREDCALLCAEIKNARSALRRTELSYFTGRAYLALGEPANARPYLTLAAQAKGGIHYGKLAAQALGTITSPFAGKKKK